MPSVAIVDVGVGNIDSVAAALRYLGVEPELVSSPDRLAHLTHLVLPGVGAYRAGMAALDRHGLVAPLRSLAAAGKVRILGICLGMQLLGVHSEEGDCEGLGLMPFPVRRLKGDAGMGLKVPHVGFSLVEGYRPEGLFAGLGQNANFYFTHSFAARDVGEPANAGFVHYGEGLLAAFDAGHICGAQFHPEKSQSNGLQLFKNFLEK
jgi:glutamine amidotransferase